MLGGMIAISLQPFLPLPCAVAAAVALTGLVGVAMQLVFLSWLRKPGVLRMIIITIGLSILMREAALHVWDEKVHALPYWTGDETTSVAVLGARVSPQVLWVLVVSALMVVGADPVLPLHPDRARRCAPAPPTAPRPGCAGSARPSLVTLSFFIAAAMGALAGCVVSPITQIAVRHGHLPGGQGLHLRRAGRPGERERRGWRRASWWECWRPPASASFPWRTRTSWPSPSCLPSFCSGPRACLPAWAGSRDPLAGRSDHEIRPLSGRASSGASPALLSACRWCSPR